MIDNTDQKILAVIQRNASLPLSEISKRVGVSPTPCWNRIKKMEEMGVISARTIVLNRKAINLSIVVYISTYVQIYNYFKLHYITKIICFTNIIFNIIKFY